MTGGYMRIPVDEWGYEHHQAKWTPENPAPSWWIITDVAWCTEQRKLPSARVAGALWGISKDRAARLIRKLVTQQAGWEARVERRAAIMRILEEWAAKEPKHATAAPRKKRECDRSATGVRQPCDSGATGDQPQTPDIQEAVRQSGSSACDTSRVHISGLPTASYRLPLQERSAPADAEAPADPGEVRLVGEPPKPRAEPPTPTPRKPPAAPGYHEAIAAFDAEHLDIRKTKYPWMFKGRDSDGGRVKAWLATAQVTADDQEAGVERIRGAARAYLRAVEAGTAWPIGEPASTRHFTRELPRWLQTDPQAEPTGPPPRASPRKETTADVVAAIQKARQKLAAAANPQPDQVRHALS